MNNIIYNSYFYIIQHIESKIYYAGVRYAKKCNPNELLTIGGYYTSSNIVKNIILKYGLNSFVIRKIKQFKSQEEAINYETRFLKRVNARTNDTFFNMHNNTAIKNNLEKCKQTCLKKYGVEYVSQIDEVKEKRKQTMLDKYGEDCFKQTLEALEKCKQTCLKKYGVEYVSQIDEVIEKRKQTTIEKYGVTCVFNLPVVVQKAKNTSLERYGCENALMSPEILKKTRESCLQTLGVEYPFQNSEIILKNKELQKSRSNRLIVKTIRLYNEKYGLKIGKGWYQMSDIKLQKILDNYIEAYGIL